MDMHAVMGAMVENAKSAVPVNDGDYLNDDGLLMCGKCHTPKQVALHLPFGEFKPLSLCKCELEKRDAEKAMQEAREKEERIKKIRSEAFPESSMQSIRFDLITQESNKIAEAARRYSEHFDEFLKSGKGILFYGSVGTGKTFISCCIANALLDKGYGVHMTSIPRLSNILLGMMDGKQDYIDRICSYPLLIIDDLRSEGNTEYRNEVAFNVINTRYDAKLPLIVTSNVTTEQLRSPTDIVSERIYSRIMEMCHPIKMEGQDIRREKAKSEFREMSEILGV